MPHVFKVMEFRFQGHGIKILRITTITKIKKIFLFSYQCIVIMQLQAVEEAMAEYLL